MTVPKERDIVRELVWLEIRKEELDREKKAVEKQIKALHEPVLAKMTKLGLKNFPTKEGPRVDQKRFIFVSKKKDVPNPAACALLRELDLEWLVGENYDSGKLKEHVVGLDNEAIEAEDIPDDISELVPDKLLTLFNVTEETRAQVTGAKALAGKPGREKFNPEPKGEN